MQCRDIQWTRSPQDSWVRAQAHCHKFIGVLVQVNLPIAAVSLKTKLDREKIQQITITILK